MKKGDVREPATQESRQAARDGNRRLSQGLIGEDPEWKVGGRYKVGPHAVKIWSSPDLRGSLVGEVRPKDTVLLLDTYMNGEQTTGYVMPPATIIPGWLVLEDRMMEQSPLIRKCMEGSWEMKARYAVKNPATLREGPNLTSPWVGELEPGQEVLVLKLGIDRSEDGQARLRAMVSTETELIGWLSPETVTGDRLLDPMNLLGPKVVEHHRKSLSSGTGVQSSLRTSRKSAPDGGVPCPWKVGGQYRVLEKLTILEERDLMSTTLGKVSPGCLVTVQEMNMSKCPQLGVCPCAFIVVCNGPEEGQKGWVRCAAKDGHDLMDSRDQLEFEKITHKLRTSLRMPGREAEQQRQHGQGEVDSETEMSSANQDGRQHKSQSSSDSSDSEEEGHLKTTQAKATDTAEAYKRQVANFADKLEEMDETREERAFNDGAAVEDKGYMCGCNCGKPKSQ